MFPNRQTSYHDILRVESERLEARCKELEGSLKEYKGLVTHMQRINDSQLLVIKILKER